MEHQNQVKQLLERLVGRPAKNSIGIASEAAISQFTSQLTSKGVGFTQFNEILLQLGFGRISFELFQYIRSGEIGAVDVSPAGLKLASIDSLAEGVERFRILALLEYGDVRHGFKRLSRNVELLAYTVDSHRRYDVATAFMARMDPGLDLKPIKGTETYYLGYLVQRHIDQLTKDDPQSKALVRMKAVQSEAIACGKFNQEVYLCSDHMDVYVATSMREWHEYVLVHEWTKSIFEDELIKPLNLRWFDPTQAYCSNRIDKGLAEALMLKRATCTIYFGQETDTLGKDSELASTLAQGKPVIAYLPEGGQEYAENLYRLLCEREGDERSPQERLLEQLRFFDASLAWTDPQIRRWCESPAEASVDEILVMLGKVTKSQYDKRAATLKEAHPLGIQVNLNNGVANGVLVVRKLEDCARLLRKILTQSMEYSIEEAVYDDQQYLLLKEEISQSVYRVMTGDKKLINSFWNFYIQ